MKIKTCLWELDTDGYYKTKCKAVYTFIEGVLKNQAGFKYCPFCSKLIREVHRERDNCKHILDKGICYLTTEKCTDDDIEYCVDYRMKG